MKEILFRGYSKRINKWVYGDLIKNEGLYYIAIKNTLKGVWTKLPEFKIGYDENLKEICVPKTNTIKTGYGFEINFDIFQVEKETIGQYTNINDINEEKIFEGDIIKYKGGIGMVVFEGGCYMVKNLETEQAVLGLRQCVEINNGKIIGNIMDYKG